MFRKLPFLFLVLLGVLALTLAACGDDDDDDDDGDDATPTATADGDSDGTVVAVDLNEWEVAPDASSAPAGEVEFAATNSGSLAHELVIVRSALAADELPVEGGLVPEDQVDVIGEIEEFAVGQTVRASFRLEAGDYLLICNINGHYEAGMRTAFSIE